MSYEITDSSIEPKRTFFGCELTSDNGVGHEEIHDYIPPSDVLLCIQTDNFDCPQPDDMNRTIQNESNDRLPVVNNALEQGIEDDKDDKCSALLDILNEIAQVSAGDSNLISLSFDASKESQTKQDTVMQPFCPAEVKGRFPIHAVEDIKDMHAAHISEGNKAAYVLEINASKYAIPAIEEIKKVYAAPVFDEENGRYASHVFEDTKDRFDAAGLDEAKNKNEAPLLAESKVSDQDIDDKLYTIMSNTSKQVRYFLESILVLTKIV